MAIAHINIGSNLGNRAENLARAIAEIALLSTDTPIVSKTIESEPWGFESANRFLNIGVNITTQLTPDALLHRLQQIEKQISDTSHRTPSGQYADRIIDIDLICVDNIVCNTPNLTLPHPRLSMRRFVLLPLLELLPEWQHPLLHLTPARMLSNLSLNKI